MARVPSGRHCGHMAEDWSPMQRAELSEAEYLWDMAEGAPPDLARCLGLAGSRVAGGVVRVVANDPAGGFWNRCIGLGMTEPITDPVVEEVTAFSAAHGAPLMCMQVAPGAQPEGWQEVLAKNGLIGSARWVKFMGPLPDIPEVDTDLDVRPVTTQEAPAVAETIIAGFGMPPGLMTEWCVDQLTRPDWGAYAAWDGDRAVAGGMLFVNGDTAHLVGAATMPEARGRGAQSALMRARVEEARRRGCRWIGTETGAEGPGNPNPSLHNMRRLGFTELYERQNWVWRP